jgi:hypothetical protein
MATLNDNALTSLADVKESLNVPSSDHTKDNLIIRKINQASQAIENYCERVFKAADYVEQINGSDTDELTLRQRPVNTFTSLEYRSGVTNVDSWFTMSSNYYFVDNSPGLLKLLFGARGKWDAWRATYNAGYTTIPSDLQEACASLAAYYVQNADALVQVRSKQEGQRRIDYYQGITGFRNLCVQLGIDQILDGYANWPLISE